MYSSVFKKTRLDITQTFDGNRKKEPNANHLVLLVTGLHHRPYEEGPTFRIHTDVKIVYISSAQSH